LGCPTLSHDWCDLFRIRFAHVLLIRLASFGRGLKPRELGQENGPWILERVEFRLEALPKSAHTIFEPASNALKEEVSMSRSRVRHSCHLQR
jgi:hypothetical protein